MSTLPPPLTWVEISHDALVHNVQFIRSHLRDETTLAMCVKANAWGHGLVEAASAFIEGGADWLCVDKLFEAQLLRAANIKVPIYIMGYVGLEQMADLVAVKDIRLVIYNYESVDALAKAAATAGVTIPVHIKIETGTHRQGLDQKDAIRLAQYIAQYKHLSLEGIATHFADLEDSPDHIYAKRQLEAFREADRAFTRQGITIPIKHCANSAATLLLPQSHMDMVRVGISGYGMWPSPIIRDLYLKRNDDVDYLIPAFTWKAKVAQVRTIPEGSYIGYGCTYRAPRPTTIAIVPVGYYDGYPRALSNIGTVLVNDHRSPVLGRVMMNMIVIDVTDCGEVPLESEVILVGGTGPARISCEEFASWDHSINYVVPTRVSSTVNTNLPRVVIRSEMNLNHD